jgi:hypothetical protein
VIVIGGTDNFERALRFARDDTAEQKLDKLEALVTGQYGRPREDLRFIAAMLSIPCEERYGAVAMTPQKFKDETLRALADTTEAIARRQPTVMLLEDVHWADPTTLEVIDLLIHRVRNLPLLIALTHRPEFSSRWAGGGSYRNSDMIRQVAAADLPRGGATGNGWAASWLLQNGRSRLAPQVLERKTQGYSLPARPA